MPFGTPLRKCVVAATEAHLRDTHDLRVLELGYARHSYGKRIIELCGGSWTGIEPLVDRSDLRRLFPRARKALPDGEFANLLSGAVRRAGDVVVAIHAGKFHPTADTGFKLRCGECDFEEVCRGNGEALRIAAMEDAGLFPQVVPLVEEGGDSGGDAGEGAE